MKITEITAYPLSWPLPAGKNVTLGIGKTVKRDTVLVKVTTAGGLVGWGEAHHGRCPGAVAHICNTTIRQLALGMEATDVVGVWKVIHQMQLASHGMGAGCAMAMSGLDMALWDIRAKAAGWPLYKMLGGSAKSLPAYAGGISLGYQEPESLADEAERYVKQGFTAVKLRIGDTVKKDLARIAAVRNRLGDDIAIMTDANARYSVEDARTAMPALDEMRVYWLEEPFSPFDDHAYSLAFRFGVTALAAGENHFTRFDYTRLLAGGHIRMLQPDLSKVGGITEGLRVAAMAGAHKLPIHPHTSASGVNMAVTIHFMCAIDNPGYFEADMAECNAFRSELTGTPYTVEKDGTVRPLEKPGIGLDVDEKALASFPLIEGPGYIR